MYLPKTKVFVHFVHFLRKIESFRGKPTCFGVKIVYFGQNTPIFGVLEGVVLWTLLWTDVIIVVKWPFCPFELIIRLDLWFFIWSPDLEVWLAGSMCGWFLLVEFYWCYSFVFFLSKRCILCGYWKMARMLCRTCLSRFLQGRCDGRLLLSKLVEDGCINQPFSWNILNGSAE